MEQPDPDDPYRIGAMRLMHDPLYLPQAWRITRPTTCRPRQTLRRQEFPKQSIWRSEGCWATPQSTRRTADSSSAAVSTVVMEA
jgi:hypothetical protein